MLARKLREREEYVRRTEDDRVRLAEALETNSRIPHDLRGAAAGLLAEATHTTPEDDAPQWPGRTAVTTTHRPSSQLKSFAKHMSLVFGGIHVMRGGMSAQELGEYCRRQDIETMVVLGETRGTPSSLVLCRYPHGPSYHFSLFSVKYQRRKTTLGERAHLVVDGLGSETGRRLRETLRRCFPATERASRVVAVVNRAGTVAFRHYLVEGRKLEKETEFDMRLYKIVGSTLEADGDIEYALRPHTNSGDGDILA